MRIQHRIRVDNLAITAMSVVCMLISGSLTASAQTGSVVQADIVSSSNLLQQLSPTGFCYIAGNVGIGTATPSNRLHIVSSGNNTEPLKVNNSNGNPLFKVRQNLNYGDVYVYNGGGTSTVRLVGWSGSSPNSYFLDGLNLGTTTSGGATLYVKPKDTWPFIIAGTNSSQLFAVNCMGSDDATVTLCDSGTGKVYIAAAANSYFNGGNVGIGTNNPSVALHVTGQGKFEQGLTYVAPLGDVSMGSYTNQ